MIRKIWNLFKTSATLPALLFFTALGFPSLYYRMFQSYRPFKFLFFTSLFLNDLRFFALAYWRLRNI